MDTPILPRDIYKYNTTEHVVSAEGTEFWELEHIDWAEKLEVKVKGLQFPLKGFVAPYILKDINTAKAIFLSFIAMMSRPQFILGTLITFGSKKKLDNLLYYFNRSCFTAMRGWILKDKHISDFGLQLHLLIFTFLYEIGVYEEHADRFAEILVHLVEYDNAYRLRLVDLFSETTATELAGSPIFEIRRILNIVKERDTPSLIDKMKKMVFILTVALFIPKIRRAFKRAVEVVEFEKLQYDDADKYYACMRTDYLFMGMSPESRKHYAEKIKGWTYGEKTLRENL